MSSAFKLTRRRLLSTLPMLPAIGSLRAQQPTFSAGVKVVNLFATVRDKKGQVVRNLTKEDFLLEEEGRPQTIRYFAQESNLPLTVGLAIDTSGSTRRVLPEERSASFQFLRQAMRQDTDAAFIVHFDFETELLQDLTSSHKLLERALDELAPAGLQRRQSGRGGYPGGGGYPRGGGYPGGGYPPGRRPTRGGGTVLYDAVFLASDEILKRQTGRKALIVLSDGLDNGSKVTLSHAVESVQRADSVVYSILFEDPDGNYAGFGGPRRGRGRGMGRPENGKQVLDQISRETGGRFFEVSRRMPIDKVFTSIEEDLRSQYSLGYTPEIADASKSYRRIRLSTRQKGLVVQTREGYYPS